MSAKFGRSVAAVATVVVAVGLAVAIGARTGGRRPPPAAPPDQESEPAAPPATERQTPRAPRPAPPPPASPRVAPPRPAPPAAAAAPFPDEPALMERLHALGETNPALSLELARQGNARFPGTPDAPERAWIVVKSLVNMERFDEARQEARIMVGQYPDTSWSLDVQRHLLSNPP